MQSLIHRDKKGHAMSTLSVKDAKEAIYDSIHNENLDLDDHIRNLKNALREAGEDEASFEPARLVQNNRQGRKMMQTYFRKRGVRVSFAETAPADAP